VLTRVSGRWECSRVPRISSVNSRRGWKPWNSFELELVCCIVPNLSDMDKSL
jgi:hypothetical protein